MQLSFFPQLLFIFVLLISTLLWLKTQNVWGVEKEEVDRELYNELNIRNEGYTVGGQQRQ